jgi:hypothetical protein
MQKVASHRSRYGVISTKAYLTVLAFRRELVYIYMYMYREIATSDVHSVLNVMMTL